MPERVRVLFDERVADRTDPDAEEEMEVNVEEYIERLPPSTQISEEEREEGDAFTSSPVEERFTLMLVRLSVLLLLTEKRNVCERLVCSKKLIRSNLVVPLVTENTGVGLCVRDDSFSSPTNLFMMVLSCE